MYYLAFDRSLPTHALWGTKELLTFPPRIGRLWEHTPVKQPSQLSEQFPAPQPQPLNAESLLRGPMSIHLAWATLESFHLDAPLLRPISIHMFQLSLDIDWQTEIGDCFGILSCLLTVHIFISSFGFYWDSSLVTGVGSKKRRVGSE